MAKALNSSEDAIWRLLKKEGIHLNRQRSWCISTDKNFAAKAADLVGLYLNPPVNAIVICVDEKPGIQALESKTGYVETNNGKVMRGIQSTYKRNRTLNLFAVLQQKLRGEKIFYGIWMNWLKRMKVKGNCM